MRAVIQRVSSARVTVGDRTVGAIGSGLLVLLGVAQGDNEEDSAWLAQKTAALRIFEDAAGKMNLPLGETGGDALVVSQFTLTASTRKGARPSFNDAAKPDAAIPLYQDFVRRLETILGRPVPTGEFGAYMQLALVNDGPVTLVVDSRLRE
jgi:D-tyrosyl-tRNA(Tyr) deacylase